MIQVWLFISVIVLIALVYIFIYGRCVFVFCLNCCTAIVGGEEGENVQDIPENNDEVTHLSDLPQQNDITSNEFDEIFLEDIP